MRISKFEHIADHWFDGSESPYLWLLAYRTAMRGRFFTSSPIFEVDGKKLPDLDWFRQILKDWHSINTDDIQSVRRYVESRIEHPNYKSFFEDAERRFRGTGAMNGSSTNYDFHALAAENFLWEGVTKDVQVLKNSFDPNLHSDGYLTRITALMNTPLVDEDASRYFLGFRQGDVALLIAEYLAISSNNLFSAVIAFLYLGEFSNSINSGFFSLTIEQVKLVAHRAFAQDEAFWLRSPEAINSDMLIWINHSNLSSRTKIKMKKTEPTTDKSYYNSKLLKKNIENALLTNRGAVVLACKNLRFQIDEYREKFRGINSISPDVRRQIESDLIGLRTDILAILDVISKSGDTPDASSVEDVSTYFKKFRRRLNKNMTRYIEPNNLADASLPIGIILACSVVGGALGGPLGFGAGSVFGKLITGEAKPSEVSEKVIKAFSEDE